MELQGSGKLLQCPAQDGPGGGLQRRRQVEAGAGARSALNWSGRWWRALQWRGSRTWAKVTWKASWRR